MRVLVDATAIPENRGGVGRYVDAIVPALLGEGIDVVCVTRAGAGRGFLEAGAEVHAAPRRVRSRPARFLWEQVGLPSLARRVRADILLSPHYTMPLRAGLPVVATLHDATFFTNPEWHVPAKARFFRLATRVAVRRAAALVVPSVATRDEVLDAVGGDPADFFVAHHGVDSTFQPAAPAEVDRVATSLGVEGRRTVVFLGTLEPRKNVVALIDGWVEGFHGRDDAPTLVLVGARGWDEAIDGALARVPADLHVVRAGYVPLEDLPAVLSGATVVAYPSLGEGFGLPVLEAMACGAPVLTTKRLSLPEVGGDAVAYTETSASEIARSLVALVDDAPRRAALGTAGRQRALQFTWSAAAQRHAEAFDHALRRRGPDRVTRRAG